MIGTTRQAGAALFVCLVLIAALAILSIAAMQSAALNTTMTANLAYERGAAAAARSGISTGLQSGPFSVERPLAFVQQSGANAEFRAEVSVAHVATTEPPVGFSMGRNASAFSAHHFEIDSHASGPRAARVDQKQGFYILGPRLAEL
jgi:hypothetical protein